MEVVGEVFLSALLEPLLRKLTSGDLLNFVRKTQVEKELNKWRRRLSEIDAVLKDADEKQITSSTVKIWLTKLRDLAYDVEDVLDEFQTEALASKVRAESQASSSTVRKLLPTCCAGLNPSAIELNMRTGSRLRDITTRLEAIAKEKNELDVGIMAEQRPKGVKKRPHRSLEELSVTSYGGTEFPSWIGDSCYSKLVHLKLLTCRKITSLSSVGKLPALSHLRIEGMDGVKEVYAEDFQSLETLYIDDMLGWERWLWSDGVNESTLGKFPKLSELTLKYCPRLIGDLPSCLPSLKKLRIERCQGVILAFRAAPDLTSLASLQLIQISGLVSLHDELVQALVALEDLDLEWCDELTYLWQDGVDLDKLSSLKRLRILGCEQLLSLVEGEEGILPCNLEVLSVQNCSNLEKLADGLSSLTSLRDLTIRCCRKLECFSEGAGLPLSLKRLQISHCGSLRSLPDGMMTVVNDSLLEKLVVTACPSLKWLPKGKLPKTLKDLNISWSLPEGILQRDARETSCSNLEHLTLQDLSATTFPTGEFPISLKELDIFNCRIPLLPPLHFLFHLTTLRICRCNELKSFPKGGLPPNLTFLEIRSCKITLPDGTPASCNSNVICCDHERVSSLHHLILGIRDFKVA
uniref:NBS-LRR resistance gene-like protein ARGH30 n=1 Tax=Populus alba TaxID=43335 RepID=A0A4U5NSJ3_POPAL|nr:NBS-LRR resistance gene-like protein ARGH30 [Populus alba]